MALLFGVALATSFGLNLTAPAAVHAFAVCEEPPADASDLLTITSPQPGPNGFGGPAPLSVGIHIQEGLAILPTSDITSRLHWGDGSTSTVLTLPCPAGDEAAYWPTQDLNHVYPSPGVYAVVWEFNGLGQNISFPFIQVTVVDAAPPTATPVPSTPTPTVQSAATQSPAAGETSAPATTVPGSTTAAAGSTTAVTTAAPSTTRPATTPTPNVAAAAPAAPTTPAARGSTLKTPVPNADYRPEGLLRIQTIDSVSTDPGVVATNLVIAGVTVWVLFTTVLLNQVLQDHRADVDAATGRITAPLRRATKRLTLPSSLPAHPFIARAALPVGVLLATGLIYSVLEPGFGPNNQTLVLFGSAVVGVGLVTYLCSGLEALLSRRYLKASAAVRPFPAAIAIAVGSVALSRLLGLHPGVMYGFVASCAVTGPVPSTARDTGRLALVPVLASLSIAIAAWLLIGPIRDLNETSDGWYPALLEATAAVILIGGIEGVVLSMLPLAETDGGKLYRWRRWVWLAVALVAAFLTWHVLLGHERAYFSGLRQASSMTVFVTFLAYTAATAGLWLYFRLRREPQAKTPLPG